MQRRSIPTPTAAVFTGGRVGSRDRARPGAPAAIAPPITGELAGCTAEKSHAGAPQAVAHEPVGLVADRDPREPTVRSPLGRGCLLPAPTGL